MTDVDQFFQARKADWQALSILLDRAERDLRQLPVEDINRLGALYRAAASDLALAQRDFPQQRVTIYLNQLVARGHSVLYRREPVGFSRVLHFIRAGFPQVYRQSSRFILAATLMFLLPALFSAVAIAIQPDYSRWLLPTGVQDLRRQIEDRKLWTDIPIEDRPYTAQFIMQNNLQVSFLAFGGGMLAGLLTVYTMVMNGLILGGLTGLTAHYGLGFELWTFVIGHGVVELTVIMIAGGAGLRLGWAILRPGFLRRADALRQAAVQAVWLIIGCIPLLILAGTLEGFLSPNETIAWPVKWAVGLGTGLALQAYLWLSGRKSAAATISSSL